MAALSNAANKQLQANFEALTQMLQESERERTDPVYWRRVSDELQARDHARYIARLVASSGKLVLLDKLLPKLKADGHRVLVFSQARALPAARGPPHVARRT